ncbi:MAG: hypothetical protein SH856_02995 [Flavobacteriales bacterium]|nr:hypothetical protein [Flavobacteriales bacterium]
MNSARHLNYFILFFAVVILLRIYHEITYADFATDKSCQVMCAINLINGNGLSAGSADLNNLSRTDFTPLTRWPPGYSLLLVPFLLAFDDVIVAVHILDVFFVVLFLLSIVWLFRMLKFNHRSLLWLLVFYAITFSLFYDATSTDLIAFTIYQYGILLAIRSLSNGSNGNAILIGVLSFLPVAFRHAYMPFSIVIPMVMILVGYHFGNRALLRKGIWSGVCALALVALFIMCEKIRIGDGQVLTEQTGMFFQNLKQFTPFPWEGFFFTKALALSYNNSFNGFLPLYSVLGWLVSLLLIVYAVHRFFRTLHDSKLHIDLKQQRIIYHLMGLLTIAGLILSLGFLSVRCAVQNWREPPWTYVEESRYFSTGMIFLQVCVFASLFDKMPSRMRWMVRSFVFTVFLFSMAYSVNEFYSVYVKKSSHTFQRAYARELNFAQIIGKASAQSDHHFVYVDKHWSSIYLVTSVAGISSATDRYDDIMESGLHTSAPVELIIAMPHELNTDEKNFILNHQAEKIGESENSDLYSVSLP